MDERLAEKVVVFFNSSKHQALHQQTGRQLSKLLQVLYGASQTYRLTQLRISCICYVIDRKTKGIFCKPLLGLIFIARAGFCHASFFHC